MAKTLFPPWNLPDWRQVDDSVRGGSSVSYLKTVDARSNLEEATPSGEKSSGKSSDVQVVEFSGTLDIKTLGGAGFASQKYTYNPPLTLSSKQYSGIRIEVLPDPDDYVSPTPKDFTFTIATTPSRKMPNGRTASRVMWEANFRAPSRGRNGAADPVTIYLPFISFTATYRGRPVPLHEVACLAADDDLLEDDGNEKGQDGAVETVSQESWALEGKAIDEAPGHFHTEHIFELGLMCRSGFGKQEGDFSLRITSIEAIARQEDACASGPPLNRRGGSLLGRLFRFC
ncbi:hypothetical protein FRB98_008851 [Tulasnella sp. 332]|nr:hypothetical protein FRB98_008851 [Tulasnella sp. 332]